MGINVKERRGCGDYLQTSGQVGLKSGMYKRGNVPKHVYMLRKICTHRYYVQSYSDASLFESLWCLCVTAAGVRRRRVRQEDRTYGPLKLKFKLKLWIQIQIQIFNGEALKGLASDRRF